MAKMEKMNDNFWLQIFLLTVIPNSQANGLKSNFQLSDSSIFIVV